MNDELILSCCLAYVAPQTSRGVRGVVLFTSDKVLGVKALVHQLQALRCWIANELENVRRLLW